MSKLWKRYYKKCTRAIRRFKSFIESKIKLDSDIKIFLCICIIGIILLTVISLLLELFSDTGFYQNILVEAYGVIVEIFIISILAKLFIKKIEKQTILKMYMDDIEEMRNCRSPEAAHRIKFRIVKLNEAGIFNLKLRDCYLVDVNLKKVNLQGANLTNADLTRSRLSGANLKGAMLHKATFIEANLYRSILTGAALSDATFDAANLMDAKINKANLCGAKLAGSMIDGANFEGSIYDSKTTFPEELNTIEKREKMGMIFSGR